MIPASVGFIPTPVGVIPTPVGIIPTLVGIIPTLVGIIPRFPTCLEIFLTKFNSVRIFPTIFSILPYTCRNHASYTAINIGTTQKSCYGLQHCKVLDPYLVWKMFTVIELEE